jgi:hypothetical protein
MTNLNKEIASFIQLFTRKGLLKRRKNSGFSFLIKMETYNIEKIEFLKQNSKYSVQIISTDNKDKQFILMICWVTQFQKNEIFAFENSSFFEAVENRIKIFSFSDDAKDFSLPLIYLNFLLLFGDQVQQNKSPVARYIQVALDSRDEYSYPMLDIENIRAFSYLINGDKRVNMTYRLNLQTGNYETRWTSRGKEHIKIHDNF